MKNTLIIIILSALCGFSILSAQYPGDRIFKGAQILEFRFEFKQSNYLEQLYQSQEDGAYFPAIVEIEGVRYDSVGVRFKGTSSFYGYPGDKKSLRIKFDKYREFRFDGLKKINLNNGWSDPSLLREKLYLDFLYERHIPAPRANFARVYLNDVYWGLYSMVEHVDKTFLDHRFDENDGNLYKAEKLADLSWQGADQENYYDYYDLKTNKKTNDWGDLLHLIDLVNHSSDEAFSTELETVLHTEGFIRIWAANNLFMNLDDYVGSANNFYLYKNEAHDVFEWIIWDVNLAFGSRTDKDTLNIFYNSSRRPLVTRMLNEETYRDLYIQTMQEFVNDFHETYFFDKMDSLAAFIAQDYRADTLKMYTNDEIVQNLEYAVGRIPGLKTFISNRRLDVLAQLDSTTAVSDQPFPLLPEKAVLFQNYPNPFNPVSRVTYILNRAAETEFRLYDALGQIVRSRNLGYRSPGEHHFQLDAADLPSGVYYYRISSGTFSDVKKCIILK